MNHLWPLSLYSLQVSDESAILKYRPGPVMLLNCLLCFWAKLQNFPHYAPIMLHCALLCSVMLHKFIKFLLLESENNSNYILQSNQELWTLKSPASLDNCLTVLLKYYCSVPPDFWLIADFVFSKIATTIIPCIVFTIIPV